MTIDYVLKMFEPEMEAYEELTNSYIIVVGKRRVMYSKDVINGLRKDCTQCGEPIILRKINNKWVKFSIDNNEVHQDYYNYEHEHRGTILECYECGREFCFFCKSDEGSMSDRYCGC